MVPSRAFAPDGRARHAWTAQDLLDAITAHYLRAGACFTGVPVEEAAPQPADRRLLGELVAARQLELHRGSERRPRARAFPGEPVEAQLQQLARFEPAREGAPRLAVFPAPEHLVSVGADATRPRYTRRLAGGQPELTPAFFEPAVVDSYRNDSRYVVTFDGSSGSVALQGERCGVVVRFGTGLNASFDHLIAAFIGELGRLDDVEQQRWHPFELDGEFRVHPAYFERAVLGEYVDDRPMWHGVVTELEQLQGMSVAAGLPPLMHRTAPTDTETPLEFLDRPTGGRLHDFHITLDCLMGRNLNRAEAAHGRGVQRAAHDAQDPGEPPSPTGVRPSASVACRRPDL